MINFSELFIERLGKEIKRSGFSRASVAEKIEVSKSTITRYLDGSIGPNASSIAKLAVLFGCSADYLLGLSTIRNDNDLIDSKGVSASNYETNNSTSTVQSEGRHQVNKIGRRISYLEKMSGMTGKTIAETIGVSQQRYSAWKKGKNEPSSKFIEKIIDLHGSSLDYIYGRTDNPKVKAITNNDFEIFKLDMLQFYGLSQEEISSISSKDFELILAMIKTMREQMIKNTLD